MGDTKRPRKPSRKRVVALFLAGESIWAIVGRYWTSLGHIDHHRWIQDVLREALDGKRRRRHG